MNTEYEITKQIVEYKWIYGFCSEAVAPIIYGITITVALKIVFQIVFLFKKKKDEKKPA